jgi:hypothetical protein
MLLSREITDEEAGALSSADCGDASIAPARWGGDDGPVVTRVDIRSDAPTLKDALEQAMASVATIPELSVASMTVPPYGGAEPPEDTENTVPPENRGTAQPGPASAAENKG